MPLPARASAAALSAATALALATACGMLPDDAPDTTAPYARLTAPEVVNKALAATRAAKSVRMTVETTSSEGPVEAFVATDIRGECTVTLSMGAAGTMELVRTGGTVYARSDAAMLRSASATDVKKLTGHWVEPAAGDRHAEMAEHYCDRETFLGHLAPKTGTARKERTTAPGSVTPALTVTGGTDDGKWRADIATDGRPFLLRLRLPHGGTEHGTGRTAAVAVEFSGFDKPFTAKKPKT
ncbi:hypothetical protein [Streptomyces sp. NBC_00893]|uniref:hypothetical protein n=1 Tax=Streptomyces sp. NBC_00893 TaxID=2975862 RepID=UPI00224D94ED|nr:hypothetical protein [Streptomyces sp. NBC_00893]MCX4847539.1 hypothetical protein [Streptomyces sp. NBC_00893]